MMRPKVGEIDSTEAAVRWYRKFVEGDPSLVPSEEFAEWAAWSAKPENIHTFREVHRIWGACSASSVPTPLPTDAEIASDAYDGSISMSEWLSRRGQNETTLHWRDSVGALRVSPKALALVACLAAIGVGLALNRHGLLDKLFAESYSYSTTANQRRTVTLSDGSVLTLASGTALTTHYTASHREIVLDQGEAWFKVARESARPFTVAAGTGVIVALGTQFDVRRERRSSLEDRITVVVGSGTVEVRSPSRATISADVDRRVGVSPVGWTPARLVQGQEVTYDSAGHRGAVQQVDLDAIAGWKQVKAEYQHTPLKKVIDEVNRYSDKTIVLSDPDGVVGALPFSGTVFEFQLAGWLQALQATYPVEVIELPDRFVIRSRTNQHLR